MKLPNKTRLVCDHCMRGLVIPLPPKTKRGQRCPVCQFGTIK